MIGLAHLGLHVKSCQKSSDFYCQYLDCVPENSWQSQDFKAIELRCGNLLLELLEPLSPQSQIRGSGIYDHLAFKTDSIEASIKQLSEQGVTFETAAPKELMNGKKIIFFRGPDDERIELVEEP